MACVCGVFVWRDGRTCAEWKLYWGRNCAEQIVSDVFCASFAWLFSRIAFPTSPAHPHGPKHNATCHLTRVQEPSRTLPHNAVAIVGAWEALKPSLNCHGHPLDPVRNLLSNRSNTQIFPSHAPAIRTLGAVLERASDGAAVTTATASTTMSTTQHSGRPSGPKWPHNLASPCHTASTQVVHDHDVTDPFLRIGTEVVVPEQSCCRISSAYPPLPSPRRGMCGWVRGSGPAGPFHGRDPPSPLLLFDSQSPISDSEGPQEKGVEGGPSSYSGP